MLDEIRQQPEIVRAVINTQFKNVELLATAIVERKIRFAYIAARGTSDNVATYAKYLLEIQHGIPTALASPAVFTVYDAVPNFGTDALVIGISQSGEAPDVIAVVDKARSTGVLTAAITIGTPATQRRADGEYTAC
jgi:glucosamine--fructose-6-phosphate aminotransferase (isomerizing)